LPLDCLEAGLVAQRAPIAAGWKTAATVASLNCGKTLFAVAATQGLVRRQFGRCAALQQKKVPLEPGTRTAVSGSGAHRRLIPPTKRKTGDIAHSAASRFFSRYPPG